MSTILLTYELGGGLGHLNRLIAVAQRLQGDHNWVFALPDRALGEPIVRRAFGDKARVLEGIRWRLIDPNLRKIYQHTFAEIGTNFGLDDDRRLSAKTALWHTVLQGVVPHLVIADFAPTLRLALGGKVPFVVLGSGYTVPPPGQLLPPIRPWEAGVPALSRANEGRLLAAVNVVRAQLGGEAIDFFSDLFSGEYTFVCTLPEFDPYRRFRRGPTLWPLNIPNVPLGPPVNQRSSGSPIFVYLPAVHPALPRVIYALNGLKLPSSIHVSRMTAQALAKHCGRTVRIHSKPADLARVLPNTSLLIHHGGLGTACAGLLAGVPQLVLPFTLEDRITATVLERAGVGKSWPARAGAVGTGIRDLISSLLQDGHLQETAMKAARNLAARRPIDPISEVVKACQQHL